MAVSIAVNWTPPASSPLFDDDGPPGEASGSSPSHITSTPLSSSSASTPTASSVALTSSPTSQLAPPLPVPTRTTSPQPRSYAAAAGAGTSPTYQSSLSPPRQPSMQRTPSASSSSSQPHTPPLQPHRQQSLPSRPFQQQGAYQHSQAYQLPQQPQHHPQHNQHSLNTSQPFQPHMPQPAFIPGSQQQRGPYSGPGQPPHTGIGLNQAYSTAFGAPPNQFNWGQYQQMMAAQSQGFYGPSPQGPQTPNDQATSDAGERQRTASSPQRPAPLTYNDTFHQQTYPGVTYATASRGNLPPGAMAPAPLAPPQGNGFHPYRRQQPRPSGGDGSSSSSTTSGPNSSVGVAAPPTGSQQLVPPQPARARSSSTNSNESAPRREAAPAVGGAPPVSFSAAAASSLKGQPGANGTSGRNQGLQPQAPTQASSMPESPLSSAHKRPEPPVHTDSTRSLSSGAGGGSEGSMPHSRTESISSQTSSYSTAASDKASTVGRATPLAGAKKPSPLSRQPAADDEDDDTNAEYGGSDGEEPPAGRATPTLGGDKKKGLGGKLRKALSLSTMNEIQQQTASESAQKPRPLAAPPGRTLPSGHPSVSRAHNAAQDSISGSIRGDAPQRGVAESGFTAGNSSAAGSSAASISSRRSGRPPLSGSAADGSGKRSLFNRKFNSSTDNISISSTVSSASVMLRKVGNLGKLARRHSLMGLTNMFNKDKDGKDGLHSDDFGALPPTSSDTLDDAALGGKSKKGKKGKGSPAAASVSHATVEQDIGSDGSMTPAAHYVRQHQLQMRQQAEQEAQAARERQDAAEAARIASLKAKGGKTTDDVVESRQKMIEKEKERLKSKRGWRNKLRVGGGSSVDQGANSNGLETVPYGQDGNGSGQYDATAPQGVYAGGMGSVRHGQHAGAYHHQHTGSSSDGQGYGDEEELLPPHMPAAVGRQYGSGGEESGDEFETDSLRHWGEGIERSRASAALVDTPKSILKKSASSSQLSQMGSGPGGPGLQGSGAGGQPFERPFAGRVRANSYDAPQAGPQAGAPMLSAMSTTQDGADKMDGVGRSPSPNNQQQQHQASPQRAQPAANASTLGHHSNSSMPTLSLMTNPTTGTVPRPSMQRKRIVFTEEHIYHSTWPAHVYDRRGELATCNRLTAELAQQIKEELNSYKMEEMVVAPSSRIYTHFFV